MKQLLISVSLLIVVYFMSCSKKNDFGGQGRLGGLLTYYNPYSGEVIKKVLANRKIFIAYHPSDTLNYIYSVTTDASGYFMFTALDKTKQYDIFFDDTANNVEYKSLITRSPDNDSLLIVALPAGNLQNGVSVMVTDTANNKVQGITVAVYDNFDLFNIDTATKSNANAVFTLTTNQYGLDSRFGVAAGKYFFAARKISGSLSLSGYAYDSISTNNVKTVNIKLSSHALSQPDSATVYVIDSANFPVSGAGVYLYSSYIAYSLDTSAAHPAASYSANTNGVGIALFPGIPVASYFIRADKNISTVSFSGSGFITLQPNATRTDTVTVLRK